MRCTLSHRGVGVLLAVLLVCIIPAGPLMATEPNADIAGTVTDSATGQPLQGSEVILTLQGRAVSTTVTDQFGRFIIHDLALGEYSVTVRLIGFRPESRAVSIRDGVTHTVAFRLSSIPVNLQAITVTAQSPIAVDTRSGDQVFKQNDFHGAPTITTSQILQQSIVGAVRAPTGEVHIRGQHAEYTYYVDGVPVNAGISGSLNELFDPEVVDRIDFQTGGWDAEFGDKNAAIVNVLTRIPSGGFHADASTYVGSFNSNGQSLNLSNSMGRWGFFASGSRQSTAMRREPVMFDTLTDAPINLHNSGEDLSGFGKLQFTPSARDAFNLDVNWTRTRSAVPFDSTGGTLLDDHQRDINAFANLSWRHRFAADSAAGLEEGSDLFTSLFYRHGSLQYNPGADDDPSFIFFPDTTPFNLREDRSFNTTGTKIDFQWRPSHAVAFKTGTLASVTTGHELFVATATDGSRGPVSNSGLSGHDLGVYAQTVLAPTEWFELRTGARYDTHVAPFAGNQHQLSPRVKVSFFPDPANTFYAYYGRLFVPTNVEDLRAITSAADSGVVTAPTLPERDDFFEMGYIHRFPFGVVAKLSAYHKRSAPGIDDNTVPGSAIVTSVNIAQIRVTGIESVIEIRPRGPVSGYLNLALSHAYGHGPITGGFFPASTPTGWFDLDHDQRLSAVASAVYSVNRFFLSTTGIYGSGLTNGLEVDASDPTLPHYGTGLFDFNSGYKVKPNFVLDLSAGYSIILGGAVVRPQLYVNNVFDSEYLLKGAFFSGASVGRPRSMQLRVSVAR